MKKLIAKVKNLVLIGVFWGFLIVSFLFFATLIILKANGYQLNAQNFKLSRTGMVILDVLPEDSSVTVNSKLLKSGFPKRITNLRPASYEIIVSAPEHQSWQKIIEVEEGLASAYTDIVLFKQSPIEFEVPENLTTSKISAEYKDQGTDLTINDSEIYWREQLITRSSSRVLAATMYTDAKHIVYQKSNQIRVIDLDGSNDKPLVNLIGYEPTSFSFSNDSTVIYYVDEGQIRAMTIR